MYNKTIFLLVIDVTLPSDDLFGVRKLMIRLEIKN